MMLARHLLSCAVLLPRPAARRPRLAAQLPALPAEHALLAAGEQRRRCPGLGEPPAEPAGLPAQGAVHAQVKALQLAGAEEAGRGTGESAVGGAPPHSDAGAQLAPHVGDELVGGHAGAAPLSDVRVKQPEEGREAEGGKGWLGSRERCQGG